MKFKTASQRSAENGWIFYCKTDHFLSEACFVREPLKCVFKKPLISWTDTFLFSAKWWTLCVCARTHGITCKRRIFSLVYMQSMRVFFLSWFNSLSLKIKKSSMEATSSFIATDELVFQEADDVKTWTDDYLVLSLFIN